jgi:hypothetical protein
MIVSIGQPCYFPWLGYFDRLVRSDLHIILDHVQMDHSSKSNFTNRNKIRTAQGWTWLTVPLNGEDKFSSINQIRVAHTDWQDRHLAMLSNSYARAPFFAECRSQLLLAYKSEPELLIDYIDATTGILKAAIGVETPCVKSSALEVTSTKSRLILDLCRRVGATHYLSGPFGRDYLDLPAFQAADIGVSFHDYRHPTYRQNYPGFEPYMSAADVLFNHGPEALRIISRGACV